MENKKIKKILNRAGYTAATLLALPFFFYPTTTKGEFNDQKTSKKVAYSIERKLENEEKNKNLGYLADKNYVGGCINKNNKNKDESKNAFSIKTGYFMAKTKRLDNGIYSELSYERKLAGKLSFQASGGYMGLKAKDVANRREETLTVIPLNAGLKYKLIGPLSIKGGASMYNYHLDCVKVPSEFGGYVGVEFDIKKGKNFNVFLEARQHFGDIDIDYPLLEDETNICGMFVGGGIRLKF